MPTHEEDDIDDLIVETDAGGRPTEYGPIAVKEICNNVSIGMTLKDSANLAGFKYKTVLWWLKVHPEFSAQYARAKLKRKQLLIATVRSGAQKDPRVALEMLARLHPYEWGKMQSIIAAKQTDKAAELAMLLFQEVTGQTDDDVDQFVGNADAAPAAPVSETPPPVLLLPAPRDVESGSDDNAKAE
jgi:hypothetical protein